MNLGLDRKGRDREEGLQTITKEVSSGREQSGGKSVHRAKKTMKKRLMEVTNDG